MSRTAGPQQAADWDPELYRTFEEQRTRPARDLLARVGSGPIRSAVDLGCGPGNSTELLAAAFPSARITGIDSSDAMLSSARQRLPHLAFEETDIATWRPGEPPDLIFANAVLQWLPDHGDLLPRLLGLLGVSGTLAIQMPDNLHEPSHRLMREVAQSGPWQGRLGAAGDVRARTMLGIDAYYDLLAPQAADVDVWRTVYHHPMPSAAAIVTWLRSTGLRPFLEPLPEPDRKAFLMRYEAELDQAYPPRADSSRLFAFPRLFIVARRRLPRSRTRAD